MSEKVAIIGTGDYGLALGKRLIEHGFCVVFGSRKPTNTSYLRDYFEGSDPASYSATSVSNAWSQSTRFVFMAVPAWAHANIVEQVGKSESGSKIVIEISNLLEGQRSDNVKESNAEKLQALFRKSLRQRVDVIKGFNLTSAFSISGAGAEFFNKRELTTIQVVPIAGDDADSKRAVIDLCHRIGFSCHDIGSLKQSALKLELINVSSFDEWYYPTLASILFFAFNWIAIFINYFLFPKKPTTFDQYVRDFSVLSHTNKCLAFSSLQILAFVYSISCLAYIYQLRYATKHKRFPAYLDSLLRARKHLGLWAFFFASLHMICSIFIMNPFYLADWYRKPDQFSSLSILTTRSEVTLLLGIVAYSLLVALALTSVNAIGNGLNWAEWRFVQTKLGLLSLSLATLHDFVMYMRMYNDRANLTFVYLITRMKLVALYFPIVVLLMRLFFSYFPPVSNRLDRIRNNVEPDQKKSK